jgi:23S rRNA A2030 N6-methylase RlmJ
MAEGRMQVRFHERPAVDAARLVDLVETRRGSLTPSGMMILPAPERASQRIRAVREILEEVLGKGAA